MIISLVVFIYIGMGFRDTGFAINELLLILWIWIGVICVYRHSCFCSYINQMLENTEVTIKYVYQT